MERLKQVLSNQEENYILPFFWQHGESESTLREYMQAIKDANISEVCLESRPHPDFAGPKWWEDLDVIINEAKKLQMKIWILDDSHFPTGFANGAVKKAPFELRHKYMVNRSLEMFGPVKQAEFPVKSYMEPTPLPPWIPQPPKDESDNFEDDELVRIFACEILPGEVLGKPIDLTPCIDDEGFCRFDLPEGYFRIYVVYLTRNARGRNDYINFLDKESCRILIDAVYEPHYERYKAYFGNTILGFFSDEPPIGNTEGYTPVGPIGSAGQNLPWSRAAWNLLTKEYGSEDWISSIPYLWANAADQDEQAKIRNAYMEMVSRLVAECFSSQLGEWCSAHGVEYIGHMLEDCDMHLGMGISMAHFFRGLSGQHMAGVDNIGGQDVPRHESPAPNDEAGFYHYMIGKMAASHAAIDPKKKGRALCENFGAYGWHSGPKEQKFLLDHYMARGVNHFVPHAFRPAPFPDPDCPPHFYAHGENPTYRAFGDLMAYTNRVCALISDGMPKPDAAMLYNAEAWWAGNADSQIPVCRSLGESQIDFHIIPSEVFENTDYPCEYDGKLLKVNGVSYHALLVTGSEYVNLISAEMICRMTADGFPVVFTNKRPRGIIGATESENRTFAVVCEKAPCVPVKELGGLLREGKVPGAEALIPETVINPSNKLLTAYHYSLHGAEEYILLNEMPEKTFEGSITVKAEGKPLRYFPWENRLEKTEYERLADGRTEVKLSLNPLELTVLLFLPEGDELPAQVQDVKKTGTVLVKKINSFTVSLADSVEYLQRLREKGLPMHGADAFMEMKDAKTLTAPFTCVHRDNPDFSGYVIYETPLELIPGFAYELQIDDAYETVEAFFNGKPVGVRVQGPFRFDIPSELVKEENLLRIEAATLADRKARKVSPGSMRSMSADRPFTASGIVGEVRILRAEA